MNFKKIRKFFRSDTVKPSVNPVEEIREADDALSEQTTETPVATEDINMADDIINYVIKTGNNEDFSKWCYGITNDPFYTARNQAKITGVEHFKYWDAGNRNNAIRTEQYLQVKGFRKKSGERKSLLNSLEGMQTNSSFVYVFMNE